MVIPPFKKKEDSNETGEKKINSTEKKTKDPVNTKRLLL
jgi:hypothetical protein